MELKVSPSRWLLAGIVIFMLLFLPARAAAQENIPTITDDEVNAVAKQLYCPVCENIPLDVCGTQACQQWRDLIREKLGEGWTEEQVKVYFVQQYGDRVLAEPPARGLNWLVYLVPPIAFLIGVIILVIAFRSWKKPAPVTSSMDEQTGTDEPPKDEYMARLEEELRRSQ